MVMMFPVVVIMILAIPMPLVPVPSVGVMVPVSMAPICTSIRRTVPVSRDPYIASIAPGPETIDPHGSRAGRGWPAFPAHGWRRITPDHNTYLRESRHGQRSNGYSSNSKFGLPIRSCVQSSLHVLQHN